ncbi:MAG: polysaccharide biosynthesis protein [Spirochaetes bacterium]|nr:polysaccharide biosynthesis protein [Spirochaetota bacterium]
MKKIAYIPKLSAIAYIVADAVSIVASYFFAAQILQYSGHTIITTSVIHLMGVMVGLYMAQSYRILWRYATIQDYYRIIGGFVGGSIAVLAIGLFIPAIHTQGVIVCGSMGLVITITYRTVVREVKSHSAAPPKKKSKLILIAGAGEAGRTLLAEFKRDGRADNIIGFVDDNKQKVGTLLCGKPVLGTTEDIPAIVEQYHVKECIVAMPSASQKDIDRIIKIIRSCDNVTISILPAVTKLFEKALTPELRGIGVEELIGREEIEIDSMLIEDYCKGKTILVTGAGGSIGSEICRQLLQFKASRIVALGRGEYSIYNLQCALGKYARYFEDADIVYYIADVNDAVRMQKIMEKEKPHIVFHAAAHKYVDIMEQNPQEAIRNNCIGTRTVLEAACNAGVQQFVCISTDKAVRPVSVMGATKRMAEIITLAYNCQQMRTCCVRFGNVIGSRGSVIPLFYQQIANGGPVTITHPEMTRYFMSIPEAVMLVIHSAVLSQGGEIFVLDMGKQYRVEEVARNLIKLLGYEPDSDIQIVYTGIRPGEKLHEDLWDQGEELLSTAHKKIYRIAHNGYEELSVRKIIKLTPEYVQNLSNDECKEIIKAIVTEYKPYS